jgi:hypothetical protein
MLECNGMYRISPEVNSEATQAGATRFDLSELEVATLK